MPRALVMLVAVFLTVTVWERRGTVAGLVALVAYGLVFAIAAFKPEALARWSRSHPIADSALFAPFTFLALASLTDLALEVCALIGVGAWLVLLVFVLRRRATAPAS